MLRKAPNIWTLKQLLIHCYKGAKSSKDNVRWVPARPIGFFGLRHRFKCAWMAFTGKADLIKWPQGQ